MSSPESPASAAAFDDLLERVEPRLRRLLATYRIPREDAEDVLQQTLLALLYHWERVRDPECWLLGTLKRHCLMYWRRNRRQLYAAVDSTVLEWLSQPLAPQQERDDLMHDLESALSQLPPRCRSLLELRFRLGYEPPEVAAQLGYQPSSIGKLTARCLAALSRELLGGSARETAGDGAGDDRAAPDAPVRR
jgi:RNA polymerase sigma factor (sigma-70 family)